MSTMLFSVEVLKKAIDLAQGNHVVADSRFKGIYRVTSGENVYRVQTNDARTYWTCTCKHGLNVEDVSATRCSHVAAAMMLAGRKK